MELPYLPSTYWRNKAMKKRLISILLTLCLALTLLPAAALAAGSMTPLARPTLYKVD